MLVERVKMTKTTKAAQRNHESPAAGLKKAKNAKIKVQQLRASPSATKRKVAITKEQEAAIVETITLVIKNQPSPKAKKTASPETTVPNNEAVAKSKKLTKDNATPKELHTAKKTAPNQSLADVKTSKLSKIEVNADAANPASGARKQKAATSRSPSGRSGKSDNNDNDADNKQKKNKAKQEEEKKGDKQVKDNKAKGDATGKSLVKDREATQKLIKQKKSDGADKLTKEISDKANDAVKNKKQVSAKDAKEAKVGKHANETSLQKKKICKKTKDAKSKESIKKPIAVKVKKVNLRKLNKASAVSKMKNTKVLKMTKNETADAIEKSCKNPKIKANMKLKIKEEQLDEVISEILKSSTKSDKTNPTKSEPNLQLDKKRRNVKTTKLKAKIKHKMKSKLHNASLATLKNKTVVVKKPNKKAKLVTKPIPQVKSRKLLSIWNGPKRHRVASLNALAKVHCLYENESRNNFDHMDVYVKKETPDGKGEKKPIANIKMERKSPSPQPTRTLRCVPGLRAVGKMWDMHDTTSSSSEDEIERVAKPKRAKVAPNKPKATIEKSTNKAVGGSGVGRPKKPPVIKRRKKEEIVMDLKDMVVRKRMASLNASAILAASYSVEKRAKHGNGGYTDDSETSDSDDDYTTDDHSEHEMKKLDAIKKEEKIDRKLIEVHAAAPNKKVAVILNQDTDVTFTGVYVNSTTRSTHHEGYCRIANMQYRISATSHTQTAATAVATETILQSSTTTHENENGDAAPVKSYTPLDALSNMQPPANPNSALPPHHHLAPPPPPPPPPPQSAHHIVGAPHVNAPHHGAAGGDHLSSLTRRHGCASAFSAPPSGCGPQGHHHLPPEHHGYVQGYYQPAGPLISVHGHTQAPPPPTISSKSAPLADTSPTPTSPLHPPPPSGSAGDSSDSEVVITSVTTAKDAMPSQPPSAYRLNHHYPLPHHPYASYGSYPPQYYTAPPPPGPTYSHHDMCYSSYPTHKYMCRRYLAPPGPTYYQSGSPDIYGHPPNNANPQVASSSNAASGNYQSTSGPPPPMMDPYPGPPPTIIETYPPPPSHYYQGYAASCYSHPPPARSLNYINATYQTCPCPMQSCPKNVHTGPLAGDSKRSNIVTIAKESIPLPPVALALPLEPASATGPPSPARGSAGMPPPPSPAGATYQPPPPPKLEVPDHASDHLEHGDKRRKARVGKAMVRNTIAQNQNTMLLMCQTQTQNTILQHVKREVESPKEETTTDLKRKTVELNQKTTPAEIVESAQQQVANLVAPEKNIKCEDAETLEKAKIIEEVPEIISSERTPTPASLPVEPDAGIAPLEPAPSSVVAAEEELLLPCQKTVAENVKVKNMKRKLSMSKESGKNEAPLLPSAQKKQKLEKVNGSYKDLIKKTQNVVKINNGKRKLISDSGDEVVEDDVKKDNLRNLTLNTDEQGRRIKLGKPLTDRNLLQNGKLNLKESKSIADPELIENKEPDGKKSQAQSAQSQMQNRTKKLLLRNPKTTNHVHSDNNNVKHISNIERTIESVVSSTCASKLQRVRDTFSIDEQDVDSECKTVSPAKKSTKREKKVKNVTVRRSKSKETPQQISRNPRKSAQLRWSNGWRWHGESFEGKVFLNSDEEIVTRKCYSSMIHEEGDIIELRDCVLLKAGQKKNELPFVAKIAALWENPDDGEMMMSLLWYYRPEHTEQGRRAIDQPDEVFASRHKDSNSVACIEDKCYVLTYNEYCRYRKEIRRHEAGVEDNSPSIPQPEPYPRQNRQPPSTLGTSADLIFFCRKVYDFRQKRIIRNPN